LYTHATRREAESRTCPGLRFTIRRISYGRRSELAAELAQVSGGAEHASTTELLKALLKTMVVEVSGLEVDGAEIAGRFNEDAAIVEAFLDAAPEELVEEILEAVLQEMRLDDDAIKNCAPPSGTPCAATEGGTSAASAREQV
jgi:hypothetical protein